MKNLAKKRTQGNDKYRHAPNRKTLLLTNLKIISLRRTYVDDFLVRRTGQTIVKHSETLVFPQSDKLPGIVESVGCTEAQSLGDAGQIPQVENVVKL